MLATGEGRVRQEGVDHWETRMASLALSTNHVPRRLFHVRVGAGVCGIRRVNIGDGTRESKRGMWQSTNRQKSIATVLDSICVFAVKPPVLINKLAAPNLTQQLL